MIIGVPKEIKTNENRVALVPAGAQVLSEAGHTVLIETEAGRGSGFADEALRGGRRRRSSTTADEVWAAGRDDHEGQGADRGGVAPDAAGPADLHLLPFRGRRGADPGGDRLQGASRWPTRRSSCRTASCRSSPRCRRSPAGWRCRRAPSTWRRSTAGGASCWGGARRGAGRRGDHRWRGGGHQRGQDGGGTGRQRHHSGSLARAAPLSRRRAPGQRQHSPFQSAQHPGRDRASRPGQWAPCCCPAPRRPG